VTFFHDLLHELHLPGLVPNGVDELRALLLELFGHVALEMFQHEIYSQ
jgi:hypothetical protein